MRIERVNESTIKLFITYQDIENRGFKKDDLWMNRSKGEEFFWSIMDEVNQEQDDIFEFDGPLWIQVHAYDKGVEVVVSKTSDEQSISSLKQNAMSIDNEDIETFLKEAAAENSKVSYVNEPITVKFNEFECLIKYTNQVEIDETVYEDLLYVYNNEYYYQIFFDYRVDFDTCEGIESKLLEYSDPSRVSDIVLNDYGKVIMSNNVRRQVRKYFI